MKKEELAALLNGRPYRDEISDKEAEVAEKDGLVVVFGASDDLCELRGAIYDEVGAYEGATVSIFKNKKGWQVKNKTEIEDMQDEAAENGFDFEIETNDIEAVWSPEEPECSWIYKTGIPHATFKIMEEDDLYCVGIVFSIKDLK